MIKNKNHQDKNHFIYLLKNNILPNEKKLNVNSYHKICIKKIDKNFDILACSKR